MPRDAELDQLHDRQEEAFQRKQETWQKQNDAWTKYQSVKERLGQAYQSKQLAYNEQQSHWQDYAKIKTTNGPRIDDLNSRQETAYENMKEAFDNASASHEFHDGLSAKKYSEQGHSYQAEAKECVEERRRLVQEIRNARSNFEPYKTRFDDAKVALDQIRVEFNKAKSDYLSLNQEFKQAKADFTKTAADFKTRLDHLKQSDRNLAEKAGVPLQYLDEVKIKREVNGTVNFYFGGLDKKDGNWHGHISTDSLGNVTYKRFPMEEHGKQNYVLPNGESYGTFQGQPAKIVVSDSGNSNRVDIYYGGKGEPDGGGHEYFHNHIGTNNGSARYWRENGQLIIDDKTGLMP